VAEVSLVTRIRVLSCGSIRKRRGGVRSGLRQSCASWVRFGAIPACQCRKREA